MTGQGPTAAVRVTLNKHHLDEWDALTSEALREVHALMWDAPAQAAVYLDLGPCRIVDSLLIGRVATLPCATRIVFESPRWRVAQEAARELDQLLQVGAS